MGSLENDINQDFQDAIDVIQRHSQLQPFDSGSLSESKHYETLDRPPSFLRHSISYYQLAPHFEAPGLNYEWDETSVSLPESHMSQLVTDASMGAFCSSEASPFYPNVHQRHAKGRKKLRLYEYLHEALHDANMRDSIQWTDRGSGIFHFISKNKEKLAECWGQRKGNRKTMTYQKMARALRNYSRTGEIVKVRRKLTYQFNPAILQRLSSRSEYNTVPASRDASFYQQQASSQHIYYSSALPECHYCYSQYSTPGEYDLATALTLHHDSKTGLSAQ